MSLTPDLIFALHKLFIFRWVDKGYGQFTCRSCGALKKVDYGDQDIPPSEKTEQCSKSCPWRIAEEAVDQSWEGDL